MTVRWIKFASEFAATVPTDEVQAYFTAAGHPDLITDDLAWSVAIVGLALHRAGARPPKTLTAKSYLRVGTPLKGARPGAIVVIGPEDAPRLAFAYEVQGSQIVVLGGQQAGAVGLSVIPVRDVLGVRWPAAMRGPRWIDEPAKVAVVDLPPPPPAIEMPAPEVKVPVPMEPIPAPRPRPVPPRPMQAEAVDTLVPFEPMEAPEPSMRDILSRIDLSEPLEMEPPAPESDRLAAKRQVQDAAQRVAVTTVGDQIRYELAMQARNGSTRAIMLFEDEARERGMSAQELAHSIISDRSERERRVMRVYLAAARVEADLDEVPADIIMDVTAQGIAEINAEAGA